MKVIGVIVTYQPEKTLLKSLVKSLSHQVKAIIIVDNNSYEKIETAEFEVQLGVSITLLNLDCNKGVGFAQNIGISKAREQGVDAVVLFDQDSLPAPDMVSKLATKFLSYGDNKVAAVGPAIIDSQSLKNKRFIAAHSRFTGFWKAREINSEEEVEVPYLIASGSLIPIAVLKEIGVMKEGYFIDRIDTEWCFRARASGYKLVGVPSAKLYHSLGESAPMKGFQKHNPIPWHQPFRHYYVFRNTILMLKQTEMPLIWKLHAVWRLIQVGSLNLLFSQQRAKRLKFIWFGIIHGLSNVTGKLNPSGFICEPIDRVKW